MGGCLSCSTSKTFKNIRLVHLNGFLEEFDQPITIGQVTGKRPRHIVCTRAQLLSHNLKSLTPNTLLQPGHIYFLLPFSTFHSEASPMDLANIARKLTTIAKSAHNESAKSSPSGATTLSGRGWNSPVQSPRRVEAETGVAAPALYGGQNSCRGSARSWKPILDTIREKSFNRRSESDLQD